MIICSCNVLSDHDVRAAVHAPSDRPRTAGQVYGCLGCSAQCGRCARTIHKVMTEALVACARGCCAHCSKADHHPETDHRPALQPAAMDAVAAA